MTALSVTFIIKQALNVFPGFSYQTRGIAGNERMRSHIAGHHTPGADYGAVTDGDTGKHRHRSGDPHVIADRDRSRPHYALIPF